MIKQYPHYLFVKVVGASKQDEHGDWVNTGGEWKFHSLCREETNGKGSVVALSGGKMYTFGALIQCPKGTSKIQEGTEVMVCQGPSMSIKRITATCMKASVDQHHTRIWV